jgi:hypothetical protein
MESKWGLIPDMDLGVTLGELIPLDLAKAARSAIITPSKAPALPQQSSTAARPTAPLNES